jgi:hypothetical protein
MSLGVGIGEDVSVGASVAVAAGSGVSVGQDVAVNVGVAARDLHEVMMKRVAMRRGLSFMSFL